MSETLQYCGTADLKPGDRVRCKQHPELTGTVKSYEWNKPGVLSAIPYNIAWDNSGLAADLRGWMFVYASDTDVERIPDPRPRRLPRTWHGHRGDGRERGSFARLVGHVGSCGSCAGCGGGFGDEHATCPGVGSVFARLAIDPAIRSFFGMSEVSLSGEQLEELFRGVWLAGYGAAIGDIADGPGPFPPLPAIAEWIEEAA